MTSSTQPNTMKDQEALQQQPEPATQGIEPAPPAYSPETAAPEGIAVKDMPANLNTTPQQVPGVVPLDQLGDHPQWIDCPFCHRRTLTRLDKEGTPMQIVAGVLCCMLCVLLACVPCIAGWFEETNYFCSQCNHKVAKRADNGSIVVYGPTAVVPSRYAPAS